MFVESGYNRKKALDYAKKWALSRNPAYYDFEEIGGDCTNFLSQCLYAGTGVMNPKLYTGWYYYSVNSRAPAWTAVANFYEFLLNNTGTGPYGHNASAEDVVPGDFVQLATEHDYYHHSGIIIKKDSSYDLNKIYIATHSFDTYQNPLSNYSIRQIRFIKIDGCRKYK